jgi:hypothetical protein
MEENLPPIGPTSPSGPTFPGVPAARQPRRFGAGLAIGVGIGIGALVVILAILALIFYLAFVRPVTVDIGASWPEEVKTVQVDGPWLKMTDSTHGTVSGWSDGGFGGGDGLPGGAFAEFSIAAATKQDGVMARISVDIYITRDTRLLMGGQPWTPQMTGSSSPIDAVFGDSQGEVGYDYLDMRELTVTFRRDGAYLIAESIDASTTQQDSPYMWGGGF